MRRILGPALGAGLLLLAGGRSVPAVDLGDGLVHLRAETYDRVTGPRVAEARESAPAPSERVPWVVVVDGPADGAARRGIEGSGARIVGYVPSNAYLVWGSREQIGSLRRRPSVVRIDPYRPSWKISPDIGKRTFRDPARRAMSPDLVLEVIVFRGEDPAAVAEGVRAAGAEVRQVLTGAGARRLVVVAPRALLPALASIPEVEWIDELPEPTLRNDNVRWVIQSNLQDETPLHDKGLFGRGEIIGHIDGEIVMGSCYFEDPGNNTPGPNHRKVVAYRSSGNQFGTQHGTHTAGTAAGDPEPVTGTTAWRGMAPKAKLSFTNSNDVSGFNDTPSDLIGYLNQAHADGARVHTNSWGEDTVGSYTTWCVDIDTFTRNNEDDLVLFAVINTSPFVTSVIAPENSKNCLAVAATYPAPNQHLHATGEPGPTFDGRRKPEVMAPGRNTRSASAAACDAVFNTGTSMAAPAVAGGAALVREYLRRGFYPTGRPFPQHSVIPTGALLKAMVVNSTVDVTGVPGYPSALEGWGRILLDDVLYFPGDARRLWFRDVRHAEGLVTGEKDEITLVLQSSFEPLAVTMAFTDQPAAHAASLAPVNDLTLEVEGPDGLFLGNVFNTSVGQSIVGGSPDLLNNVERVVLPAPTPGIWKVRVRGASVPLGPQGYAVVVNGGPFRVAQTAPAPGPRTSPRPSAGRRAPEGFRLAPMRPSPFREGTAVDLAVPEPSPVTVTVHDVTGRRVRRLLDRTVDAGEFRLAWDGRDESGRPAAAGVYFVRLTAPGIAKTVRGVLLR